MWIIITFQKRWALKFPINKNDRIFRNGLEICDIFFQLKIFILKYRKCVLKQASKCQELQSKYLVPKIALFRKSKTMINSFRKMEGRIAHFLQIFDYYMIRSIPKKKISFRAKRKKKTHVKLIFYYTHFTIFILSFPLPYKYNIPTL